MSNITSVAALIVTLAAGCYLVLLGLAALGQPERARRFLGGFAQTQRAHLIELAIRLLAGSALLVRAPQMHFRAAMSLIGWVLVGTTLALALIPWRHHQRFASWSVPMATRRMPLLGLGAILAGAMLLGALLLPFVET